jgi:hypothetical protein
VRAYTADWIRWRTWCTLNNRPLLPADPADVALYLASAGLTDARTGRPANAPTTIDRWAAAIAATHRAHTLPNPTTAEPAAQVLRVLRRRRRAATVRLASRQLTNAEFLRLLDALPPDTWPHTVTRRRDRLILTLARTTGLGPDPLLGLTTTTTRLEPGPSAHLLVDTGEERLRIDAALDGPAIACTVCAYADWRELLDIADAQGADALRTRPHPDTTATSGGAHTCRRATTATPRTGQALFRRLHRGGTIGTARPGPDTVRTLVHTYAHHADLAPDALTAFSLRQPPGN